MKALPASETLVAGRSVLKSPENELSMMDAADEKLMAGPGTSEESKGEESGGGSESKGDETSDEPRRVRFADDSLTIGDADTDVKTRELRQEEEAVMKGTASSEKALEEKAAKVPDGGSYGQRLVGYQLELVVREVRGVSRELRAACNTIDPRRLYCVASVNDCERRVSIHDLTAPGASHSLPLLQSELASPIIDIVFDRRPIGVKFERDPTAEKRRAYLEYQRKSDPSHEHGSASVRRVAGAASAKLSSFYDTSSGETATVRVQAVREEEMVAAADPKYHAYCACIREGMRVTHVNGIPLSVCDGLCLSLGTLYYLLFIAIFSFVVSFFVFLSNPEPALQPGHENHQTGVQA